MRSLKLILPIALLILFSACQSQTKTANSKSDESTSKELVYLEGFFAKNNLVFETQIIHLLIRNQADFEHYFGMAPVMGEKIILPDFSATHIGAIITQPSKERQVLSIPSCMEKQDQWIINYTHDYFEEQSFSSNSVLIFEIPKTVESIAFKSGSNIILAD